MQPRTVLIIGTGLIGTSVGLALRRHGLTVHLCDVDPANAHLAEARGAGTTAEPTAPVDVAVVAVPPSIVPAVVVEAQARHRARAYTDVAGVKSGVLRAIAERGGDLTTFVGGHPMAGGERSGPMAARADLFRDRPWVFTIEPTTAVEAQQIVFAVAEACDAVPVTLDAGRHDDAVALVSHVPHLLSSLMAARLLDLDGDGAVLAGRGLSDVVRIAAGDPGLWADIVTANAAPVAAALDQVLLDLQRVIGGLRGLGSRPSAASVEEARIVLAELLGRGAAGHRAVAVGGRDACLPPTLGRYPGPAEFPAPASPLLRS